MFTVLPQTSEFFKSFNISDLLKGRRTLIVMVNGWANRIRRE